MSNEDLEQIRNLKLVTAEEIIAYVTYPMDPPSIDPYISVRSPVQMMLQQSPDGKFGVAFVPWAVGVDGSIEIKTKFIVFDEEPRQELQDRFTELHSKIVKAPPGMILPK